MDFYLRAFDVETGKEALEICIAGRRASNSDDVYVEWPSSTCDCGWRAWQTGTKQGDYVMAFALP